MKRGQIKLSFGMIFSIILAIVFIVVAFYAIQKFLGIQKNIQTEQFFSGLKSDIDNIWRSAQGSQEFEYFIPTKVREICFQDNDYENLILLDLNLEYVDGDKLEHLDIGKITEKEDPFCIETDNGKVRFIIKKEYGENLITITK